MGLSGNLRTMALGDIMQWIAMGMKTGTLHVANEAIEKRITFEGGKILGSWSNDPRESLGQFLLRERYVTEEHIFRGLLKQEKEAGARLLGEILVAGQVLTEQQLIATIKVKAQETIYDLFLWEEGKFEFHEGELPATIFARLDLDPTGVMLEGVRRIDEWSRIRKFFPSTAARFKVVEGEQAEDDAERHLLDLVATGRTLAELSLEMRRAEFDTAAMLFDLYSRGLITILSTGEQTRTSSTVRMIRERLDEAHRHLANGVYDQALKAYEEVLAFDRLNQTAKKGVIAVVEAKTRARTALTVDQSKVPHIKLAMAELTELKFDPLEGFVLSRVNGEWDVASILKLCPMAEDDALAIFARLIERGVIELGD